eukprot:COSAG02_NODE_235_length_27784_cov_9.895828_7_plen_123_part_00
MNSGAVATGGIEPKRPRQQYQYREYECGTDHRPETTRQKDRVSVAVPRLAARKKKGLQNWPKRVGDFRAWPFGGGGATSSPLGSGLYMATSDLADPSQVGANHPNGWLEPPWLLKHILEILF